jgi:hypothetical protein
MAAQWAEVEISVADVLEGAGRAEQRRLRASHNLARHCPICVQGSVTL